jgi:P-type Cu+ transporter
MTNSIFTISLPVASMVCCSPDSRADEALNTLPGVSSAALNPETHRLHLEYDPGQTTLNDVIRAVQEVGYLVMNPHLTLHVRGMSSAFCAERVEQALKELPGVEDAAVKLRSGTVRVRYVASAVSVDDMKRAVDEAGYQIV